MLLCLFGRAHATSAGDRCPLAPCSPCLGPGLRFASPSANLWAFPSLDGAVGVGSPAHAVQLWHRSYVSILERSLHSRLFEAVSTLSVSHVDRSSTSAKCGPMKQCTDVQGHRILVLWGLAPWGHDLFPGGRVARHLAVRSPRCHVSSSLRVSSVCRFPCAVVSSMLHSSGFCACWVRHPWLFNVASGFNNFRNVLAHVSSVRLSSVGQACERFVSLTCSTKPSSRQAKYDLLSSLPPRNEGLGRRDRYGEGTTQTERPTDLTMFSCGTFGTIIGHVFDLRHSSGVGARPHLIEYEHHTREFLVLAGWIRAGAVVKGGAACACAVNYYAYVASQFVSFMRAASLVVMTKCLSDSSVWFPISIEYRTDVLSQFLFAR